MTKKIKVSLFILLSANLIFTGCGGKNEAGRVGEGYSFTIEAADATSDTEYHWRILDQPLSSILSQKDLSFSDHYRTITFMPEYEGKYSFQAIILQYGDTVSVRTFEVEISKDESASAIDTEAEYVEDESWLEEPVVVSPHEEVEVPPVSYEPEVKKVVPVEPMVNAPAPDPEKKSRARESAKPKKIEPLPGSSIPVVKGRYTIQVSSWPGLESAEKEYSRLVQEGFDAYVQRAYFTENKQTWYRVRVGSYGNYDQAAKVSKRVSATLGVKAWVDFVRKDQ